MSNKLAVVSCVGASIGVISGLVWNRMNTSDKVVGEENTTSDGELTSSTKECKCPMANFAGVSVTTGVLSGALTWYFYPQ